MRFFLLLLCLFGLAVPSLAQSPLEGENALDLTSAQSAFESFRQSVKDGFFTQAESALDYEGIPLDEATNRQLVVVQLAEVLDSDEWDTVNWNDSLNQEIFNIRTYVRADADNEVIGSVSMKLGTDGLWRFSSNTVRDIQKIWDFRVGSVTAQPEITTSDEPSESESTGQTQFSTPRKTLETYLTAMNEEPTNFILARQALDLSQVNPLIVESAGDRAAAQIFGILNRTLFVELDKIPDRTTGEPFSLPIEATYDKITTRIGTMTLAVNEEGNWQFTQETIASLDLMWEQVKSMPVIGDLKDLGLAETPLASAIKSWLPSGVASKKFLGMVSWQWLAVLVILILSYAIGVTARIILKLLIRLKIKRYGQAISNDILRQAGRAFGLLISGIALHLFLRGIFFPDLTQTILVLLAEVATVIGAVWFCYQILEVVLVVILKRDDRISDKTEKLFIPLARNFGKVIILIIALLYFLQRVGWDITSLIAGLGVGGLIFALAAKDSVENIFGSFTVLFEMPFQIGDWVIIGEIDGNVEEISIRSTRIRTFKDSIILVPNSLFISTPVENMGQRRYRRIKTNLGVTYDTPPDKVEEFISEVRQMVKEHPHTWKDKMHIYFNDFGASSLDIMLYIFVDAPDWGAELARREDILLRIMRIAEDLGVEFAFPTTTTILKGEGASSLLSDQTDG